MNKIFSLFRILLLFCCVFPPITIADVTPTEVYRKVELVAAEIDLIRQEMGFGYDRKVPFQVSDAQPREVYFQAFTLFEKSNRLLFEQLRERDKVPVQVVADVQPSDVLTVVENSLGLLMRVKSYLSIPELAQLPPSDQVRTPTDVFKLIVEQNRILNQLLQRRFAPSDVYQQLTYGVGITSSLLATLPVPNRLGTEPEFERRKTPTDVYARLLEVFHSLCGVMRRSGEACLEVDAAEKQRNDLTPSDVYDLASLVISELRHLHSERKGTSSIMDSYFPGDKLPSHAYQRAGRLLSQILILDDYSRTYPGWLKP